MHIGKKIKIFKRVVQTMVIVVLISFEIPVLASCLAPLCLNCERLPATATSLMEIKRTRKAFKISCKRPKTRTATMVANLKSGLSGCSSQASFTPSSTTTFSTMATSGTNTTNGGITQMRVSVRENRRVSKCLNRNGNLEWQI